MTRRVLFVRPDGLGDVVLCGPAVRAVAASGAHVTMLCGPAGVEVGARLLGVADVFEARLPWIDATPRAVTPTWLESFITDIGNRSFDEAIVATSFHQSPLPTALALRTAGVARIGAISIDYPGSLLDVRLTFDDDRHEVERTLALVRAMGYAPDFRDDGRLALEGAPRHRSEGYVVVHPGASVPARTWPAPRWTELVATLTEAGIRTVVTGGPQERALGARVAAPGAQDASGIDHLDGLLRILAGADAVVVGNTGPAHLAAAIGAPVVSIYAPTVPAKRWHPWGVPHVVLGNQSISCAGCRKRVCPFVDHPCLGEVSDDDVLAALARLGAIAPREPIAGRPTTRQPTTRQPTTRQPTTRQPAGAARRP